jgi:hypothetical protein
MNRLKESVEIMKKIQNELQIPKEDSGVRELSQRLSDYVKTGKVWTGYIQLPTLKRHLHVILPHNPVMPIRVVLKAL